MSSVQGFEDIVAAADLNETEDQKMRSKKMQKIGYKGADAVEADEVSRIGVQRLISAVAQRSYMSWRADSPLACY